MMPIILKDHSWSQTEDRIFIQVNMKGIRADKASFITSDNYIRLYHPPYYFELFLYGEVDEANGKCTLNEKDSQVLFELPKRLPLQNDRNKTVEAEAKADGEESEAENGDQLINISKTEWPCLELENLNRHEKHAIRARAVELSQKKAQQEIQAALEKRQQHKQMSVQEQIRLDEEARQRIASIKTFETESFFKADGGAGDQWEEEEEDEDASEDETMFKEIEAQLRTASLEASRKVSPSQTHDLLKIRDKIDGSEKTTTTALEKEDHILRDQIWSKLELASKSMEKSSSSRTDTSTSNRLPKEKVAAPNVAPTTTVLADLPPLPPPVRRGGSINVSFTPREFPTPSRESTVQMEEEWLAKQLEARRTSGFDELKLRPEERDPSWLLEKGHELMKTNSYLGATSAFTTGLKLAPKLPQLFVGRAQAQLALNNFIKTVEDATQAIQLLTPKVVQNMKERLIAHSVRGQAFRKLGMLKESLEDYREAVRLDPENQELNDQYETVQEEERNATEDPELD